MEYRDLSRLAARDAGEDDGPDAPAVPRGLKLVRPMTRLDVRKIAAAAVIALSVTAVLFYAGGHALKSAVDWLHHQPQYQLPFDQIGLKASPPVCFRGGAKGFLERVRDNANEPDVLPLLPVDPDRIERAFKLFPWVEEVESIDYPPRGLAVGLVYREPVAKIELDVEHQYLLDRYGLILPLDDVDVTKLGRLIQISGRTLTRPSQDRVGKIWSTTTEAEGDEARVKLDRAVVQSAKLAGFLLEPDRNAEAIEVPALRIFHIHAAQTAGLFVQTSEDALILWGSGPGDEAVGEPSAQEKWDTLVQKAKTDGLKLDARKSYWIFTPNGLQRVARPGR